MSENKVNPEVLEAATEEKTGGIMGFFASAKDKAVSVKNGLASNKVLTDVASMHLDGMAIAGMLQLGNIGNHGLMSFIGHVLFDTKTEEGKARYEQFMKDDLVKAGVVALLSSGIAALLTASFPDNKVSRVAAKSLVLSADVNIISQFNPEELFKKLLGSGFFDRAKELADSIPDEALEGVTPVNGKP